MLTSSRKKLSFLLRTHWETFTVVNMARSSLGSPGRPISPQGLQHTAMGSTILIAVVVIMTLGTGSMLLQLTAQHKDGTAPLHEQQQLLSLRNSSAQLSKLTAVVEKLHQQVSRLESGVLSTRTKLDTLVSTAGAVAGAPKAAASLPAAAAAPRASPSPAPHVKRLVVSMSSFPGRAEFAIPTVYSIMFGKRVPDAFYFWVAVNVSRFPDHEAPKQIPEACKNVANQFKGVLKVQVPPVDYGPATKLLPTLKVETDPDTVIVTIDDDTYYHQDTVFDLEQEMIRRKGHAVVRSCEDTFRDMSVSPAKTWRTWNLKEGLCKGFMTAYASAAYRRAFFDDEVLKQELAPDACRHHDDIWFSGHLWVRQVPIWILRPHVHAWPPMYHRPKNTLSISMHPEAGPRSLQCLDYFGWMSINSTDIRTKLLGNRQPYKPS